MFREKLPLLGDNILFARDASQNSENNISNEADQNKQTQKPKLPWSKKIAYGIGEIGVFGAVTIEGFFFATFLLEVAGLDPFWVNCSCHILTQSPIVDEY
jgi:hypothetical protein